MELNSVRKIMLVEDELVVRMSLSDYLEDSGYEVLQMDTPAAALAALDDVPPDLVICDYKMPGMNGKEFLHHMRMEFPAVPVIVFTGMADDALAKELIETGASACLFKPLPSLKLLLDAVDKAIGAAVSP
jgi:CheY-like chemotaxis protein